MSKIEEQIAGMLPAVPPLLAVDGFPVSGDAVRAIVFDPHPTHPFRMPDLLWPAVSVAACTSEYECLACRDEEHDLCYGRAELTRDECACMLNGHPEHDTEAGLL